MIKEHRLIGITQAALNAQRTAAGAAPVSVTRPTTVIAPPPIQRTVTPGVNAPVVNSNTGLTQIEGTTYGAGNLTLDAAHNRGVYETPGMGTVNPNGPSKQLADSLAAINAKMQGTYNPQDLEAEKQTAYTKYQADQADLERQQQAKNAQLNQTPVTNPVTGKQYTGAAGERLQQRLNNGEGALGPPNNPAANPSSVQMQTSIPIPADARAPQPAGPSTPSPNMSLPTGVAGPQGPSVPPSTTPTSTGTPPPATPVAQVPPAPTVPTTPTVSPSSSSTGTTLQSSTLTGTLGALGVSPAVQAGIQDVITQNDAQIADIKAKIAQGAIDTATGQNQIDAIKNDTISAALDQEQKANDFNTQQYKLQLQQQENIRQAGLDTIQKNQNQSDLQSTIALQQQTVANYETEKQNRNYAAKTGEGFDSSGLEWMQMQHQKGIDALTNIHSQMSINDLAYSNQALGVARDYATGTAKAFTDMIGQANVITTNYNQTVLKAKEDAAAQGIGLRQYQATLDEKYNSDINTLEKTTGDTYLALAQKQADTNIELLKDSRDRAWQVMLEQIHEQQFATTQANENTRSQNSLNQSLNISNSQKAIMVANNILTAAASVKVHTTTDMQDPSTAYQAWKDGTDAYAAGNANPNNRTATDTALSEQFAKMQNIGSTRLLLLSGQTLQESQSTVTTLIDKAQHLLSQGKPIDDITRKAMNDVLTQQWNIWNQKGQTVLAGSRAELISNNKQFAQYPDAAINPDTYLYYNGFTNVSQATTTDRSGRSTGYTPNTDVHSAADQNAPAQTPSSVPEMKQASIGGRTITALPEVLGSLALANQDFQKDHPGQSIVVNEGYRSPDDQTAAYKAYLAGTGGRAAPPGESAHGTGMALDIQNYKDALPYLKKYGFNEPLPGDDPGHFSFVISR